MTTAMQETVRAELVEALSFPLFRADREGRPFDRLRANGVGLQGSRI
jgi:hypothetical protein